MYVIRPIQLSDLDAFEEMANTSKLGIINLPKNRDALHKKILDSEHSFSSDISQPSMENYIFVLEDVATGKLGGTCGICSRMGVTNPNYYFHIDSIPIQGTQNSLQILVPVCYPIGPSEICALYLKPEYRKDGLGKLLSLSRFLFIASHRKRFEDYTVAEMRGYFEQDKVVPFWEAIGRKFLDVSYEEFCELEIDNRSFIPTLMPRWPIYTFLLPKDAQDSLGKTHEHTVPALKMLYKEGFTFTNEVDPFDGGPKIGCNTDAIRSVMESKTSVVASIEKCNDTDSKFLISNTTIDFRACYGTITEIESQSVSISTDVAKALHIRIGDSVRYVPYKCSTPGQ